MKKILIILLIIAGLTVLASYIFIPSRIQISSARTVRANNLASHRVLMNDDNWKKWWPGGKQFQIGEMAFDLTQKRINSFELLIPEEKDTISTQLMLIQINPDTSELLWSAALEAGNDPIQRLKSYRKAVEIKRTLDKLLGSLDGFLSDQRNIYGFSFKKVKVPDSVLISTRRSFAHYPNEFETEELIRKLRTYIKINNAKEMNYPMLHVRQLDSARFEAMAAIATDIRLPDTDEFAGKMLLKGGNLLEAQITGGHATIRRAFNEFENVIREYGYTPPAIPYELLVTDRTKETDTTKWLTKIYYPVY